MGTEKERERAVAAAGEMTPSRRQALARLGFAGAVAYVAPTILHLDRSAKATILPSCENPPGGGPPDPSCNTLTIEGSDPLLGAPPPPE
jgi:hypothetical protein